MALLKASAPRYACAILITEAPDKKTPGSNDHFTVFVMVVVVVVVVYSASSSSSTGKLVGLPRMHCLSGLRSVKSMRRPSVL